MSNPVNQHRYSLQTISVHLKPSQSTSYKTGVQPTPSFSLLSNTIVSIVDSTMVSSLIAASVSTIKCTSFTIVPTSVIYNAVPLTTYPTETMTYHSRENTPTTLPTFPISETTVYAVVLRIDGNFTTDLENRDTKAFKNLERNFIDFLTPFYEGLPGFLRIVVSSFSSGSVLASIDIIFNKTESTTTIQKIEAPIRRATEDGTAPFIIQSITVSQVRAKNDDEDTEMQKWMIILIVGLVIAFFILFVVFLLVSMT